MFLARRPSTAAIDRFLDASRELPLSYGSPGIVHERPIKGRLDEDVAVIGHGDDDLKRARSAVIAWKPFDVGWVDTFPRGVAIEIGAVVAVLVRHFGF